jgi:hypothetical protein
MMDPPFPAPSSIPRTPADDRGFYRSPQRVALLSFFAPVTYELWWLWQLFQFTRREQFPRARAFWWLLVPFYNFYVIYHQLDDVKKALESQASSIRFSSAGATWLIILATVISNVSSRLSGPTELIVFAVGGALLAAAAYLTQQTANSYQEVRYPGRPPQGMTAGEWIATGLGVAFLLLVILGSFQPV